MNTLSAVIITFNEEAKIGRCIESLQDIADEIIVVDSLSTDNTEAICRSYGARFVSQPWLGYSEQKNIADSLVSCDLVFSIDADEALSDELKGSIACLKQRDIAPNAVFSMNRLTNYCGQWIKRCGFYPDNKIRVWRKDFAKWDGLIHECLVFNEEPKVEFLNGDLLHYSYDSPEAYKKQIFHFAELGARSYFEKNKKTGLLFWLLSPTVNFIRTYIIKGGFLEGGAGFYICRTAARATRHKYNLLRSFLKSGGV